MLKLVQRSLCVDMLEMTIIIFMMMFMMTNDDAFDDGMMTLVIYFS